MTIIEIDRQEYEDIRPELCDLTEEPGRITGRHEDHGAVVLTRVDGRFWCEAEEISLVRGKGEARAG